MLRSIFWKPYSRLLISSDNSHWAIDQEAEALAGIARKIGIPAHRVKRVYFNISQVIHHTSQFSLLNPSIFKSKHRISLDYFHGKPEHGESYRKCFESIKSHSREITKIRVSNRTMEETMKAHGVEASRIMRIPIGIDLNIFTPQKEEQKKIIRKSMEIPENAIVIGSFQKDGVGWGEGLEPKLIKGPDIFLKVIEKLKSHIPNLLVLLSGPSRGYVKQGLDKIGVPYRHQYPKDPNKLTFLYDALDLYIITSREEGGPKSLLESMAKGIPVVTTEVGQCKDLVINGKNAMMAPIDDVEILYKLSTEVLSSEALRQTLTNNGLYTATENSVEAQLPMWREYFKGLIDHD